MISRVAIEKHLFRGLIQQLCYLKEINVPIQRRSQQHAFSSTSSASCLYGKENLVLMGSPGSGKTTVGRILASRLGKPVIDVDNDWLEHQWQMPVADKLTQVGPTKFIKEEGEASMKLDVSGHIISLTGSNPLFEPMMKAMKRHGLCVFLDVPSSDVCERLYAMKVDRIVGQQPGGDLRDVLDYRQQFYERAYDVRVVCGVGDSPETVADRVQRALRHHSTAGYVSTRESGEADKPEARDLLWSVLEGLAADGGLLVPRALPPAWDLAQWDRLLGLSYAEKCLRILEQWIPYTHLSPQLLNSFISQAYSDDVFDCFKIFPVRTVGSGGSEVHVLELFRGPTGSFKDAALQLMPQLYSHAAGRAHRRPRRCVLVATSGDTGSAVLDGFGRHADPDQVKVMVLYPENGVSEVQKALMTSVDAPNVKVVGVESDFDFCQNAVKQLFTDASLRTSLLQNNNCILGSANSINWGRLLPQVVLHCVGYLSLVEQGVIDLGDPIDVCVPTGNFGNILSAFYAKEMGLPLERLICASNSNNILTDFFTTGVYDLSSRSLRPTLSPAIDILRSSNLERLMYFKYGAARVSQLYDSLSSHGSFSVSPRELEELRGTFSAGWCDEELCADTIRQTWQETGYLLDPHTAVGWAVASSLRSRDETRPLLLAATAHPAKFAPDVLSSLGVDPGRLSLHKTVSRLSEMGQVPGEHVAIARQLSGPSAHSTVCSPDLDHVRQHLLQFLE